jgi:hypothetical protein
MRWTELLSANSKIKFQHFGTLQRSWLKHYATSRKVAGSSPDEVHFFNWPNPQPHYGPGVDSASNRNEYQESC